jgi:intracellular sulfur oxidation DsrE/DsrF family protein
MKISALLLTALVVATPIAAARAQDKPAASSEVVHKIAIQVSENNPAAMTLALNNAQNILSHYKKLNQKVDVQVIAFGPGLHIFREDTSQVKTRLSTMSLENPNLTLLACGNTQANQSKAENKEVKLVSEAKVVPSGVVMLSELQQRGYSYIRP